MPNMRDEADGHVRVAGEIEVELEGVGQCADPGGDKASGSPTAAASNTGVRVRRDVSAITTFLNRPKEKIVSPTATVRPRSSRYVAASRELRHHLAVVQHRTGD